MTTEPQAQPTEAGELKPCPCPFCPNGHLETCFRDAEIGAHSEAVVFHWVECDCGARGPEDRDKAEAERLWNTRADLPRAAADDPVNTYPTVVEAAQLLEAAGYGAPGKPNTLLAMVKEALAAPRAQTGLTVETTLAELREMFPGRRVEVHSCWRPTGPYYFIKVQNKPHQRGGTSTLTEAMDQVRTWSMSRNKG